ncbi:MAG: LLM class flavin-dependent oxidoreductase [Chloroflexi bacterium]|nr:LLM class flavin-dependent oxidoreductase [Chloroflexota bacterium]
MQFGLSGCGGGLESGDPRDLLDLARLADALGYAGLWINEEHFNRPEAGRGRLCLSPLILAGALSAATSRIRIGFSVLLAPLHHPLRLAEELASLDVLSGGRIDVGISRGNNGRYFEAFGVDLADNTQAFRDTLDFMRRCWTEDTVELHGEVFPVEPKPVQQPTPPIYVGAYTDESVRWAATAGHRLIQHGIQSLTTVERAMILFAEAGGDIATVPVGRFVYVSASDEQARREVWPTILDLTAKLRQVGIARSRRVIAEEELEPERFMAEVAIVGGPETVAARIAGLHARLGMQYLNLLPAFFGYLPGPLLRQSLEIFAAEVMPRFPGTEVTDAAVRASARVEHHAGAFGAG